MEKMTEIKTKNPSDITEKIPFTSHTVADLDKVVVVLDEKDRRDRYDYVRGQGRFRGMSDFEDMLLNSSWIGYICEKYNLDLSHEPPIIYNENDGMIYTLKTGVSHAN